MRILRTVKATACHAPRSHSCLAATLLGLTPLLAQTAQAGWGMKLTLEPTLYAGSRSEEPMGQAMTLLQITRDRRETGFFLSTHLQFEAIGKNGINFDLDRLGYLSRESWGTVTVGRVHPWELEELPVQENGLPNPSQKLGPWSLHGQTQSQNLGLELGFPMQTNEIGAFRSPFLAGWVGVHIHVPESATIPISFSASASPLFIPTIGGQVRFSEDESTQTGRFGRTPPEKIEVSGTDLPLYYRLNTDHIWDDILLQPQFMIQASHHSTSSAIEGAFRSARWSSHFWISRAPQPDPAAKASGTIRVSGDEITALAEITPSFPQRWTFGFTESLVLPESALSFHFDMNAAIGTENNSLPLGAEVGANGQTFGIQWAASLLHRLPKSSQPSSSGVTSNPDASLDRTLAQVEVRSHPSEPWVAAIGAKTQLSHPYSTWISSTVTYLPLASHWKWQLCAELFGGSSGTYFGEWRTNDRLALLASIEL